MHLALLFDTQPDIMSERREQDDVHYNEQKGGFLSLFYSYSEYEFFDPGTAH